VQNIRLRELERMSEITREMRNHGIRCTYVSRKNTLQKIMIEYNYRRSMNTGAS